MVSRLEEDTTRTGQPTARMKRGTALRLLRTSPGSLVAELGVPRLWDDRARLQDPCEVAIELILSWRESEREPIPEAVEDELVRIGSDLSSEVEVVRIADPVGGRQLVIPRRETVGPSVSAEANAPPTSVRTLLYGWLKAVNWDRGTAELHRYGERHVPLRFDARLDREMLLNATQFVGITGEGRINRRDRWQYFQVEQLSSTSMGGEPFDLESFLNNPNPNVFSSNRIVRTSEPFDVHDFIRVIREGRDVGRGNGDK